MAAIPAPADPTLVAVDAAIELRGNAEQHRPYLGMSAIGRACSRALWYGFRWCSPNTFDAATLKRFEDGHRGEDIQADRLRLVEGIELLTIDPRTGRPPADLVADLGIITVPSYHALNFSALRLPWPS